MERTRSLERRGIQQGSGRLLFRDGHGRSASRLKRRSIVCRASTHHRFILVQVFTDAIPFGNGSFVMAMLAIMHGTRPPRPTHPAFTESLWKLMQRCWHQDPRERPEVSEVLEVLLTPSVPHSNIPFVYLTALSHTVRTQLGSC